MPELPEVEHVVRSLRRAVVGSQIVAADVTLPKLIAPMTAATFGRRLKSTHIRSVGRRGKYILIELERTSDASLKPASKRKATSQILAVHLRMTGQFLVLQPDDSLPRHAHAIFYLRDERRLIFRDQRQFGVMRLVETNALAETKGISELAPEPFSEDFSFEYLKSVLSGSRRTLKTLLLDQTKVLGLGNIYASEALFRAGINPFKVASQLSGKRAGVLHQAVRDVLRAAVSGNSARRINLENPNGFSYGEAFGRVWQVYEREGEPCFKCGAKIRRATQAARSTYWCPRCQRQ